MDKKRELAAWLCEYLETHLALPAGSIGPNASFADHGVDSMLAVSVTNEIKKRYGVKLNANALYELPTIETLVDDVAARLGITG